MNPPPPMFPALGCVTASENAVATAASTALPPCASAAAPASEERWCAETTIPRVETISSVGAASGVVHASPAARASASMRRTFIGPPCGG